MVTYTKYNRLRIINNRNRNVKDFNSWGECYEECGVVFKIRPLYCYLYKKKGHNVVIVREVNDQ